MLLPFIEQTATYSQMITQIERGSYNNNNPADGKRTNSENGFNPWETNTNWNTTGPSAFRTTIPSFLCPSDGQASNTGDLKGTNYRMNRGDLTARYDWQEGRGLFVTGDNRGAISFSSIADGTSHTLAFSEGAVAADAVRGRVIGGVARFEASVGGTHIRDDRPVRPSVWLTARGQNGAINLNAAGVIGVRTDADSLGRRWGDGISSALFTILPPNSPSVMRNNDNWSFVAAASSYHPGGVGCVSVDGACRFVPDSVDTSSLNGVQRKSGVTATGLSLAFDDLLPDTGGDPQRYSGPSPYGAWGAYGTIANGESTTL
jgi:hypothetical protein